jgi:outer membrane receptor protein involved in Fe transport
MKSEWFDNVLRFNITAYNMVWDDIQVQIEDPTEGEFSLGTVNAPEADIFGVDAWVAWQPNESWSFNGTLGYNKGELSKDFFFEDENGDPELRAPDGTELPMMPDWKASLNAEYTFGGQLFSATPYVLAQYVYWGDSVNSIGVESSSFVLPVKDQPSWQTLGLRAGLEGDTWSAVVYVDNIFDEYQETFYNNRFAQQRLSVGRPRTLGIGFRKYFGKDNPAK